MKALSAVFAPRNEGFVMNLLSSFIPLVAALFLAVSLFGCSGKDESASTASIGGGRSVVIDSSGTSIANDNTWSITIKKEEGSFPLTVRLQDASPDQFQTFLKGKGFDVSDGYENIGGGVYQFFVLTSKDVVLDLKGSGVYTLSTGGTSWKFHGGNN